MGEKRQDGTSPAELLPYQAAVELVLGMPLLPEVPYALQPPERGIYDIRQRILRVAMAGIRRHVSAQNDIPPPEEAAGWTPPQAAIDAYGAASGGQSLRIMRGQLAIANNLVTSRARPPSLPEGLLGPDTPKGAIQARMEERMYDFVQRPDTRPSHWHRGSLRELAGGLAIISATSTGKTVPMAKLLLHAGIGRPVSDNHPHERLRALVALPSQPLLKELRAPGSMLRRILGPHVSIGAFFQKAKQTDADVQLVLNASLSSFLGFGEVELEEEAVYDMADEFAIKCIDEGHHYFEPRVRAELGRLSTRLFMTTATPAYSQHKDLRRIFSAYTASRLREAIEAGAVGSVELFTYHFEDDPVPAAIELAASYIAQGRQVAVYCRPKGGTVQARAIAEQLNAAAIALPEGSDTSHPLASAFGDFNSYAVNHREEDAFRRGDRRALITTAMFTEGVNLPIDVLIILGPRYAQLPYDQIVGRGPREPGTLTTIIELQPRTLLEGRAPLATAWRSLGLEDGIIQQGLIVGPTIGDSTEDFVKVQTRASMPTGRQRGFTPLDSSPSASTEPTDTLGPPETVHARLAPAVPVRSIIIAPRELLRLEKPPAGATSSRDLAQEYNTPMQWIDYIFRQHQIPCQEHWQVNDDGTQTLDRYYRDFQSVPLRDLAATARLNREELGAVFGVGVKVINAIIQKLPEVQGTGHDMPAIRVIAEAIAAIETATDTDVALFDLGEELEENFVYGHVRFKRNGIVPVGKWRNEESGQIGFAQHITAEEADRIRAAYHSREERTAGAGYMSFQEIADTAGTSINTIIAYFTKPPKGVVLPDVFKRRSAAKGREGQYVVRAEGLAIAELFKVRKLPLERVALPMMERYFDVSYRWTITKQIAKLKARAEAAGDDLAPFEPESIRLGGRGAPAHIYPWALMKALEQSGLRPRTEVAPIDYAQLAHKEGQGNPVYTWQVQAALIEPSKLGDPPQPQLPQEQWEDYETVRELTGCDDYAFRYLLDLVKLNAGDMLMDGDSILGFTPQALERLRSYRIETVRSGWVRLAMIARFGNHSTPEQAYAQLLQYRSNRGTPFTDKEVRLARVDTDVQLIVTDNLAREVQRQLRQR